MRRTRGSKIDPNLHIGAKLRHSRKVIGFTLKKVAKAAGCSESFLSKIENEKAIPSFATLHRLSSILGINVSALFSQGTGESVVSHAGERPVIVTDQLRKGRGIRLERLIPYSRENLLQGNIHLIAPGRAQCRQYRPCRRGNRIHSGRSGRAYCRSQTLSSKAGRFISFPLGIAAWLPQRRVKASAHSVDQYAADFLTASIARRIQPRRVWR